jgi:hypothetical protein
MKKLLLLLLIPLNLFSQIDISGTVIDSKTKEPLPYASLYIVGTNKGTIANSEGAFRFKHIASEEDEITFSYVGYKKKKIQIKQLKSVNKIQLQKNISHINEVEVGGYSQKYLAKLLFKAKLGLTKSKNEIVNAKSFAKIFSTQNDTLDVELFQAFYASEMNKYEIKENTFKNAKILVDNVYGVSVSSLDIFDYFIRSINFLYIEDVNTFSNPNTTVLTTGDLRYISNSNNCQKRNKYISFQNPMLYKGSGAIVKKFNLDAEQIDANLIKVNYTSKQDKSQKGSFIIHTETKQVYDFSLLSKYTENPPLYFVDNTHHIDSLFLEYRVKFDDKKHPNLFKLNFEYFFKDSLHKTNNIESEAELLVYDFNNSFGAPVYNFNRDVYSNDYFLADITPVNQKLWDIEPQILKSQRQGNFVDNKSVMYEYISNDLIENWSEDWKPDLKKVQLFKSLNEVFNIETMIFYDAYKSDGKHYVETAALIDYKKTYWSTQPDLTLIKKVFDLTAEFAEILKKELSNEPDKSKFAHIYDSNWNEFQYRKKKLIENHMN